MSICVCPGSFDPITIGHLDIIKRASKVFSKVIVVVLNNRAKNSSFTVHERTELIKIAIGDIPNVAADSYDGLLVDYLKHNEINIILRGVRSISDYGAEVQMAELNRILWGEAETIFMIASPEYAGISSSAVRELASYGGDISPLVPSSIKPMVDLILQDKRTKR